MPRAHQVGASKLIQSTAAKTRGSSKGLCKPGPALPSGANGDRGGAAFILRGVERKARQGQEWRQVPSEAGWVWFR